MHGNAQNRVVVCIDGFNLFFGLKYFAEEQGGKKLHYWLNAKRLAESMLKPHQTLAKVKFFTTRIQVTWDGAYVSDEVRKEREEKRARQNTYLEAIGTLPDVEIQYGMFALKENECGKCYRSVKIPVEKMTDVNIATSLLVGAFRDEFDTAILVTADSDLRSPVHAIVSEFPKKKIIVAFPPGRSSKELKKAGHGTIHIGEHHFVRSLLPPTVVRQDGFELTRPAAWS